MSSFQSLAAHYRTLGVSRETAWQDVREAHRQLISEYHPDRLAAADPRRSEFEERAKQVNHAFQELTNARKTQASQPKVTEFTKAESGAEGVKRPRAKTVERMIVVRDGVVYSVKKMRRMRAPKEFVFSKRFSSLKLKAADSINSITQLFASVLSPNVSPPQAEAAPAADLNTADFAWGDAQSGDVAHFVDGKKLVRNGSYLS